MADNLQDQLYQNIRSGLLSGRFQPGERLKIRDLAAEWGTSPMPVRAALQRLVAEGALEGEAQRSLRVPAMTRERFEQLLPVRINLEGLAVELAAARITATELANLVVSETSPLALSSLNTCAYCAASVSTTTSFQFFAAERTIAGPPMSMFSIASSNVQSALATVASNG